MAPKESDSIPTAYAAFISYRHIEPDMSVAKALHTLLETYRIPVSIAKDKGKRRIGKVFRDQEELPVSEDLSRDIEHALQTSQFLIVICSRNTPVSKWCAREIREFKRLHGNSRLLALLIDGWPDVSFPAELRTQQIIRMIDGAESTLEEEIEPLAADIRGKNIRSMIRKLKKHEGLRLLAPMLGVSYDTLRQRDKERRKRKILRIAAAGFLFAAALGIMVGYGLKRITQERQAAEIIAERSALTQTISDGETALANGWRWDAMQKAIQAIDGYLPQWEGYDKALLSSELLLQRSVTIPTDGIIGTIRNGEEPGVKIGNIVFSEDNRSMFSKGYGSSSIEQWDVATGKLIHSFQADGIVSQYIADENQGVLVAVKRGNGVVVWDLNSGNVLRSCEVVPEYAELFKDRAMLSVLQPGHEPGTYQFSVNGASEADYLVTYTLQTNSMEIRQVPELALPDHPKAVGIDESLRCELGAGNEIKVWNQTGVIYDLHMPETDLSLEQAVVTEDGRYLIADATDEYSTTELYICDLYSADFKTVSAVVGSWCSIQSVIPEDDSVVLVGDDIKNVYLVHIPDGNVTTLTYDVEVDEVGLSSDGKRMAVSSDGAVHLYSTFYQSLFPEASSANETLQNAQLVMDSENVYQGGYHAGLADDHTIDICIAADGKQVGRYSSEGSISCFTLDPVNQRLIVYSYELGRIEVWDWNTQKRLDQFTTPYESGASNIQWVAEEGKLYVSNGNIVDVVDLGTHQKVKTLPLDGFDYGVYTASDYMADTRNDRLYLFASSDDSAMTMTTCFIYQLSTGQCISKSVLPNPPYAQEDTLVRYALWDEEGVAVVNGGTGEVMDFVSMLPLNTMKELASETLP